MEDEIHEGEVAREQVRFYLIAHEHLYIFRKPEENESIAKFRESDTAFQLRKAQKKRRARGKKEPSWRWKWAGGNSPLWTLPPER
ncbi:MAG: hypothetical protein QME59_02200 [Candidatus Hydrothermarchaeota archaeon]|nr:hypothetical protein [Candidatus Hydrothermarchaeota archaeon]